MTTPAFAPDPSRPARLLAACPAYEETPLREMWTPDGAAFRVKDESRRMGLGAHKALGGVYAVARLIEARWRAAGGAALTPADLMRDDVRAFAGDVRFICASAGNHGMAVAAGARLFGAESRIYLAETVPAAFETRLQAAGAETRREGATYEESVAAATAAADAEGAVHLADTSWPGYFEEAALVMEGYSVIAEEMRRSFEAADDWPSHVYLPGGVGGTAAGIAPMIRRNWSRQPEIIVVEPAAAPCLAASRAAGRLVEVEGPVSIIGRLDCKAPSMIAFAALEEAAVSYLAITDAEAQAAADHLGAQGLPTTPSGAASAAGLFQQRAAGAAPERPLVFVGEGPETPDENGAELG